MKLLDLAKIAGVTFVRCNPNWGGTWGYEQKANPCIQIRGYKTEAKACESWARDTFGEDLLPVIVDLLKKTSNQGG